MCQTSTRGRNHDRAVRTNFTLSQHTLRRSGSVMNQNSEGNAIVEGWAQLTGKKVMVVTL
jgi:hypothetical protein